MLEDMESASTCRFPETELERLGEGERSKHKKCKEKDRERERETERERKREGFRTQWYR